MSPTASNSNNQNKKWILSPNKLMLPEQVKKMCRVAEELKIVAESKGIKAPVKAWAIIDLVFSSGLRVAEICDLQHSDLFVGHGQYSILVRNGKCGKQRQVTINERLKRHLKQFIQWKESVGESVSQEDFFFLSNRGKKFHRNTVQKMFKAYLKRAGVPTNFSIHCARHSYATMLYKASKNNLRLVQKQLGHSSVSTTQVYADVYAEDAIEAVENLWSS